MNNIIKIVVSVILSLVMIFCNVSYAYALDFDPDMIHICADDVLENTVYIDILVPLDKDSNDYTDFRSPPLWYVENGENKPLLIDEDSQIAKYNDNGYGSITLHTEYVKQVEIYTSVICLNYTVDNIYEKFKDFKAVYVDENGNILKITDTFSVEYSSKDPYAFIVNDNNLTLRIYGSSPIAEIKIFIIMSVPVLLLVILLVFIVWKFRKKKIQTGNR
ncbi:MAG: hypothetical protein NC177_13545 [Ruminococcus flavefaciens]|nr:hypothetical protein [Ruminococcus flavefaciens]